MDAINEYLLPDGTSGMLTYGCTMDLEIIRDICNGCPDMQQEMEQHGDLVDKELEIRINEALGRLPVVKVSKRHGGIQEWIEDYEEKDPGHRHISQLYGVYPGKTISKEKTPELAAATSRTIGRKYEAGYDGQGWNYAWVAAVQARLGNAQGAYEAIMDNYRRHILPNLMINAHGIFP